MGMGMDERIDALKRMTGLEVAADMPLSRLSSLGIGGAADACVTALDELALASILATARKLDMPCRVIGSGTNLVWTDAGWRGVVVRLGDGFRRIEFTARSEREQQVTAGAAVIISGLINRCMEQGRSGVEGLAGIPGTVGGAVYQNSGNSDFSISDALASVTFLDLGSGQIRTASVEELGMSYRHSRFQDQPAVILSAAFKTKPMAREQILAEVERRLKRRGETQPTGKSVGCIFRNPPGDSAGRLIDAAGLKNTKVGGLRVSDKHANFMLNEGGATFRDFTELVDKVRSEVRRRFGVNLELEVTIVGGAKGNGDSEDPAVRRWKVSGEGDFH